MSGVAAICGVKDSKQALPGFISKTTNFCGIKVNYCEKRSRLCSNVF